MIVLSGTIGAGKTSLTHMIADHLGTQAFYESVDGNPVLPLFYKDPKKYAFLLQIYFLNKRFDSIKAAFKSDRDVLDRSIFEDSLLFKLNADLGRATQTEFDVYNSLLHNMMEEMPFEEHQKTPDLLIHIRVSFDTMLARIAKRGRPYEQVAEDPSLYTYYKELNERYDKWYADYDQSPKIQIDGDRYNFVDDTNARQDVLHLIDDKINDLGIKA
ncbi:deoxynucleoside kinase [Lacticaseibacillus pabuli]|uniref:Deoxynucleoside kinase n=1 Tax=Lacticaseibacillus pabuli TaxID=3025672 RepID=A0ABY7WPF3_9LACO|nr:deoxynucleoside kinase [Lacticaseibacillus sp. KACC 23028]WDF82077.1 deoxynucleoside kinase [Lacticaseibacillus sp. KACC 23028]